MVFDVRRKKKVARNFAIAISSSHPIQQIVEMKDFIY